MNPVIMLDEVDKIGADWRGDPSAALLEVLDPAQNHAFRDHYLDVELDLSQVLFVATANVADTIPGAALRPDGGDSVRRVHDRGEGRDRTRAPVGPAGRAQRAAARRGHGRRRRAPPVVADYTREAGVRQLERELGTLLRKSATRIASGTIRRRSRSTPRPCVTRSAARSSSTKRRSAPRCPVWPPASRSPASAATSCSWKPRPWPGSGGLVLTGQLGDVMKESARIALTYVKSHAADLGIDEHALDGRELHVHVPAGAIPKDGPSAGITMVTAIASLLSRRPVKSTIGMTGEVTLQGRVLPIGGLKQKVLAAHAAGLTEVILPERNSRTWTTCRRTCATDDVPRGGLGGSGARAGARASPARRDGGLTRPASSPRGADPYPSAEQFTPMILWPAGAITSPRAARAQD